MKLILHFLLFSLGILNDTVKSNVTLTGLPLFMPGFHLGIAVTTLTASASSNGDTDFFTCTLEIELALRRYRNVTVRSLKDILAVSSMRTATMAAACMLATFAF